MIKKIRIFIVGHKIVSTIILLALAVIIYFLFRNNNDVTRYITENVKRRDIVTVVTATGQVEASNSIEIKPKNSGIVNYIGVKEGQEVYKGALIASVDCRDSVIALENAKISLAKLTTPDTLSVMQSQNNLKKSYDLGWNDVASFMNYANTLINNIEEMYNNDGFLSYKNTLSLSSSLKDRVNISEDYFYDARDAMDNLQREYKNLSRTSSNEEIKKFIDLSYNTAKILADTVKSVETASNYIIDNNNNLNTTTVSDVKTDISSWINSTNNYVSTLLSGSNNIQENEESLARIIVGGSDELDIKSSKLSLQSKQDSYNDCFTYAPFNGIITNFTAKVGESSSSSYATLITKQKIATVSFNEVDVASIKINQKAKLTFDAINGLIISGTVVEIDSVGTVNSGVVTYDVKIAFNEDDISVKPGMSVNVEIVTEAKKNILTISSSAIKIKGKSSYVEVFETPVLQNNNLQGTVSNILPIRKEIKVGITDDTFTEIIEGLQEGDQIISKTIFGSNDNLPDSSSRTKNVSGIRSPMGGSAIGGGIIHP